MSQSRPRSPLRVRSGPTCPAQDPSPRVDAQATGASDGERRLPLEGRVAMRAPEEVRGLIRGHQAEDLLPELLVAAGELPAVPGVQQRPGEEAVEVSVAGGLVVHAA